MSLRVAELIFAKMQTDVLRTCWLVLQMSEMQQVMAVMEAALSLAASSIQFTKVPPSLHKSLCLVSLSLSICLYLSLARTRAFSLSLCPST
jgi:hypothetical protein